MAATVKTLSRATARRKAELIRKLFDAEPGKLDIVKFLEKLPVLVDGINVEIVEDEEMKFGDFAYFEPDFSSGEGKIVISNSVYESACGYSTTSGRDRMTIAHEIAHYFLMMWLEYIPVDKYHSGKISPANDPEWQAKALAGELLMPFEDTKSYTDPKILAKDYGVSVEAADYRINGYGKK